MGDKHPTQWARDLQREVFEFWKTNHQDHEQGVKIFYSPVNKNPNTLFLGFNPGGSSFNDFDKFHSGDFSLPDKHEYLHSNYTLAQRIRKKIFPDNHSLIQDSVALNYIYFRTKKTSEWDAIPDEKKKDIKSFCQRKTQEVIDILDPNNIAVFGMRTWDEIKQLYDFKTAETHYRHEQDNVRLVCISDRDEPQFVGFYHPSAQFRLNDEEFRDIGEQLVPLLKTG